MCDVDFDGSNEFECSTVRTARKEHPCYECKRGIKKGERYTHHSYKWEGDVGTHKTCQRCDRVAEAHTKAERSMGGNGAYYWGQLSEMVGECAREHREYVVAFRKAWKGEELPPYKRPDPRAGTYSVVS